MVYLEHIRPNPVVFPEEITRETIYEFFKTLLKERISQNIIYRPWSVKHTKKFDGEVHYMVKKAYDFIRFEMPQFYYDISIAKYNIHSKFSKRKRKKKYLGEYREFYSYKIRISEFNRSYSEVNFNTHNLINGNI